jgi:hypothetical protein
MARGWESKSVEEQMANGLESHGVNPGTSTNGTSFAGPISGDGLVTEEERRAADQKRAARERHRQALNLQRESILSQRTSNPGRRAALEAALAQVEAQIQAMS